MKRFLLPCVLALVFLIHLAAGFAIAARHTDFFLHHDGREYLELSESYAKYGALLSEHSRYYEVRRDFLMPEAYRIQLPPVVTGILIQMGFPPLAAAAVFCALAILLASWAVFDLARTMFHSERTAWFALLLFSLHPLLIQYGVQFSSEILFCAFLLLTFRCLCLPESDRKYVLAAAMLTLAAYSRATAFLFFPFLACWFMYNRIRALRREGKPWLRIAPYRSVILFTLTALLLSAPVALRNWHNFGTPSVSGYLSGFVLYNGNNRHLMRAYSADSRDFVHHMELSWNSLLELVKTLPPETAGNPRVQSDLLAERAKEELRAMSAGEKFRLFSGKLIHYLQPNPKSPDHSPLLYWGLTLSISLLYLCGIAGILLVRRRDPLLVPFLLLALTGIISHVVFNINLRYRIPYIDLPLILYSAAFLSILWDRIRRKPETEYCFSGEMRYNNSNGQY